MVHFLVVHVFCSAAHLHTAGAGAAARGARGRALRSTLHLRSCAAVARCALPRGALAVPKNRLLHCLWRRCPLRLAHAFQAVGSCTCNSDHAYMRSLSSVLGHAHAGDAQTTMALFPEGLLRCCISACHHIHRIVTAAICKHLLGAKTKDIGHRRQLRQTRRAACLPASSPSTL